MRSHRRGENVVTIASIQPRSTNSAGAMMHSARDLQTRRRIDLAIEREITSILPVGRHGLVTAGHWREGSCCRLGFVADLQARYHRSG
jgi:hypothetical protein